MRLDGGITGTTRQSPIDRLGGMDLMDLMNLMDLTSGAREIHEIHVRKKRCAAE
jgi:hypothetical protein